jgi:hypothetical protein
MSNLPRYLRNLAFYCIVLLGALLSMVSIVVLPDLRTLPKIPPETSVDSLHKSMTAAAQISARRHATPLSLQVDPATMTAAADTTARGRTLRLLYGAQRSLVQEWETSRASLAAQNTAAVEAASLVYRADATRPGDRDRLKQFKAVKAWHDDRTRRADAYLDRARERMGAVNVALMALRDTPGTAADAGQVTEVWARIDSAHRLLLLGGPGFDSIPSWQDPRLRDSWTSWHPFAALAAWLRTQRSPELAAVIGMLGLGLLGAAVSTSVRRLHTGEGVETPMGNNITGLILTGSTAAFATFLAVKGSLAVVSTDGAQANPYVLLLTCFVAAVYWEDAWKRVRKLVNGEEPEDENKPARIEPPPQDAPKQAADRPPVQVFDVVKQPGLKVEDGSPADTS